MKKVLIALLIIIVLLVGGAYAYLALSTSEYDDIDALLAEPPMESAERYLVNSSDKTVSVTINRQDILRLVAKEMNGDIMGSLNDAISGYGVTAEAIGIKTYGDKVEADLKLKYKNFLPIPLRVNAILDENDGVISVDLDTVSIGKFITFDSIALTDRVGSIDIPDYDLKETSPLLKDIKSVDFGNNEMEITIPYPMEWLMHGIDTATSAFSMIVDFVDLEELDTPVPAMLAAVEGDDSGLVELLERDPHGFVTLKTQLLGLNGSYTRSKFFNEDTEGSYSWLLPEITEESATAIGKEIIAQYQALYDERTSKLAAAWQYLVDGYADGSIKESKGTFINVADNSEVLISELDALKGTEGWLNFDDMRIVFGENPGDFALHQVPTGNVVPAIILRTHVDRPVICYQFISTMFKVRSITEKEYEALMEAARVPVYNIGEHTTAR